MPALSSTTVQKNWLSFFRIKLIINQLIDHFSLRFCLEKSFLLLARWILCRKSRKDFVYPPPPPQNKISCFTITHRYVYVALLGEICRLPSRSELGSKNNKKASRFPPMFHGSITQQCARGGKTGRGLDKRRGRTATYDQMNNNHINDNKATPRFAKNANHDSIEKTDSTRHCLRFYREISFFYRRKGTIGQSNFCWLRFSAVSGHHVHGEIPPGERGVFLGILWRARKKSHGQVW